MTDKRLASIKDAYDKAINDHHRRALAHAVARSMELVDTEFLGQLCTPEDPTQVWGALMQRLSKHEAFVPRAKLAIETLHLEDGMLTLPEREFVGLVAAAMGVDVTPRWHARG